MVEMLVSFPGQVQEGFLAAYPVDLSLRSGIVALPELFDVFATFL